MFSALLYLQAVSLKNRLAVRLRRLRQPRYLLGAVVGGLYMVMMFSRSFFVFGRRSTVSGRLPGPAEEWEFLGGAALFVLLLAMWIIPQERAALVFSEAEIAFLFPAPVRRSTLVHYKLLKSQLGILVTVFFLTFLSWRPGGPGSMVMRAAGYWIVLSVLQLHALGASFARTTLLERGVSHWQRRGAVAAVVLAAAGLALVWGAREIPPLRHADLGDAAALQAYLHAVAVSAPARWLLAPWRALARPFLAVEPRGFLAALPAALGIVALHYVWVLRANVAFEEASVEASQRLARRAAEAIKTGQQARAVRPWRKRRPPFRLRPAGAPAVAILWKNLLAAGQLFSARVWVVLLVWVAAVGLSLGFGAGRTAWPDAVSLIVGMLAGMSLLFGPQLVRYDFRYDLAAADLLKSYPMKGWQVALGEILAPALILTAWQWLCFTLMAAMRLGGVDFPLLRHGGSVGAGALPSLLLTAAILAPLLNLLSLLIPNAAALLLPGWFAGPDAGSSGRGIEVLGQRLIFMVGQFVVLLVALAPAALVFFLVNVFAADPYLGSPWSLPACAVAAGAVLAVEFGFGLAALGEWFENYDLSAERLN